MVNVGLRAYVWNKKDRQQRVTRELWSLNGATYHAYRQYTTHVKEQGFPDQLSELGCATPAQDGAQTPLQNRVSLASQSSLAWKTQRAFSFAGTSK